MHYTTTIEEGRFTATLSESFTFRDNGEFRNLMAEISKQPVDEIICDLTQVDFVDSAALGMFLLLRDMAEKRHASVLLRGATGQVQKMFDASKFSELFTVA